MIVNKMLQLSTLKQMSNMTFMDLFCLFVLYAQSSVTVISGRQARKDIGHDEFEQHAI